MARPTKLTDATQKKIIDALRLGATYKLASQYAGISYDAFNDWMNAGQEAKSGAYFQFYHSVKEAEGAAAVGWLAKIEKAASDGTWQAAAWKLERLHGDDYAIVQKHRHGGDPDNPAPIASENKTVHIYIPSNGREAPSDTGSDGTARDGRGDRPAAGAADNLPDY